MKKIIVNDQILAGNLFNESGYDENASADKLAEMTEAAWEEYIKEQFEGEDVEIKINIDVQHNCSGSSRGIEVIISDDSDEYEMFSSKTTRLEYWLPNIAEKVFKNDFEEWAIATEEILDGQGMTYVVARSECDGMADKFIDWLHETYPQLEIEEGGTSVLLGRDNKTIDGGSNDLWEQFCNN